MTKSIWRILWFLCGGSVTLIRIQAVCGESGGEIKRNSPPEQWGYCPMSEQKHWFPYYLRGKCWTGARWWTLRLSHEQRTLPFICYSIPFTVDWLMSVKAGSVLENYCVIVAGKLVTWSGNFARESRDCVVVRSRGANQVCRLSVDHRIFTRIDVDGSFKCRTEYRILIWTCEEIYFQWSEELKLQRTDCITHNLWQSHHGGRGVRGFSWKRLCLCGQLVTRKGLKQALCRIWSI